MGSAGEGGAPAIGEVGEGDVELRHEQVVAATASESELGFAARTEGGGHEFLAAHGGDVTGA